MRAEQLAWQAEVVQKAHVPLMQTSRILTCTSCQHVHRKRPQVQKPVCVTCSHIRPDKVNLLLFSSHLCQVKGACLRIKHRCCSMLSKHALVKFYTMNFASPWADGIAVDNEWSVHVDVWAGTMA